MPHFYVFESEDGKAFEVVCQCPHGLIPHFYGVQIPKIKENLTVCQCPHGLIPHFYILPCLTRVCSVEGRVNALTGLYLISTSALISALISNVIVAMPSRAYTSFLQYPFKNLGFMRFPEPGFAGICQNLLTVTVFRAC